jgi:hypothetical protein
MTHPLIAAALAAPKTHRVLVQYAAGNVRHHDTRSHDSAETYADGERRKIGRKLVDRVSGETVTVVSVDVVAL